MEFRKMVLMNIFTGQLWICRYRDIENRFVDIVGEGEGGKNGENSFETCTLPYVKLDCAMEMCCMLQGAQIRCSVTTEKGWMGWDVGGGLRGRGHMYT